MQKDKVKIMILGVLRGNWSIGCSTLLNWSFNHELKIREY